MQPASSFVTPEQLAEHRDVTPEWVRMQCQTGKLEGAVRDRGRWRIPASHMERNGVPDEWVSASEVASHFDVTAEAIRRRCREGLIGTVRVGRRWMVERAEFDRLIVEGLP